MSHEKPVKWPGKAYDGDAGDLGDPLRHLLQDVRVLELASQEDQTGPIRGTPYSVQVITAGATALGKGWSAVVGFVGGGGALAAGVKGLGYTSDDPLLAATFTASAAVLLAAVAIAVAVMVKADVSARATASAAQYDARATITAAVLGSAPYNKPASVTPPAPVSRYVVQIEDNWFPVRQFRQTGKGVVVADLIGRPDAVELSKVNGITTTDAWEGK